MLLSVKIQKHWKSMGDKTDLADHLRKERYLL